MIKPIINFIEVGKVENFNVLPGLYFICLKKKLNNEYE